MIGRWMRRLLALGLLGGVAWLATRFLRGEPAPAFESGPNNPSLLAPRPLVVPQNDPPLPASRPVAAPQSDPPLAVDKPVAEAAATGSGDRGWVDAVAGEAGPATHPVKAKLKSGIYHLPGMLNYDRTVADRWYTDAAAAEADGLRKAKR